MAKIYQYDEGSFTPLTPTNIGNYDIYSRQTYSGGRWHYYVSLLAASTPMYQLAATSAARTIKVVHPASEELSFFTNRSTSSGSTEYSTQMSVTKTSSGSNSIYTITLPANNTLQISKYYKQTSSGSTYYLYYSGVNPNTIGTGDLPSWNEVNIKKRNSSWSIGNIYQYSDNLNYQTTGVSLSGTYIASISDSIIATRAARYWSGLTSGSTYTIELNGNWTTINGNGWDFFGYSYLSAGNTVYQTTKSNIVYDSVTDTTTLSVTLSTGTGLVFAHPNSDVTGADSVLNSINPQVKLTTGSWS